MKKNDAQELSPQQMQLILLLLQGKTHKAAAEELGIHYNTITDWKKLPVFQQEYKRIKDEYFSEALSRIVALTDDCIDQLIALKANRETPFNTLAKINLDWIRMTLDIKAIDQLKYQIQALEERLANVSNGIVFTQESAQED